MGPARRLRAPGAESLVGGWSGSPAGLRAGPDCLFLFLSLAPSSVLVDPMNETSGSNNTGCTNNRRNLWGYRAYSGEP